MTENELKKQPENTAITADFDIPQVSKTYDSLFKEITKLDKNDIICRANCKFCNHSARFDAERKYEQGNRTSYTLVVKFFDEYRKQHPEAPVMNVPNVRDHILHHYLQQEKKMWMREYSGRLTELMNYKISEDREFEMLAATLELKLHEIASDPTLDTLKQADTMTKIIKSKLDVKAMQHRLRGEMDGVSMLTENLQNVWFHMIKSEKDPLIKRSLIKCLDAFQSNFEGTVLPKTE